MDRFINSVDGATTWDGIKQLVPVANKVVFDTANGGAFPLGNATAEKKQQQKLLELIRKVLNYVGPGSVVVMNADVMARIESTFWEYVTRQDVKSPIEEDVQIVKFRGRPIVDAGYKKDGNTLVMGNDGTVGASDDCSSILVFKPGEKADLACGSNVGLVVDDLGLQGVHYETQLEADIGMALLRDKALFEIDGIRLDG